MELPVRRALFIPQKSLANRADGFIIQRLGKLVESRPARPDEKRVVELTTEHHRMKPGAGQDASLSGGRRFEEVLP